MKRFIGWIVGLCSLCMLFVNCDYQPSSDEVQQERQEQILKEGTAETGMPNVTHFRQRKLMKYIIEMCDKEVSTFSYLENMSPTIVKGHTALGGKLTYLGPTVGFGLPYSTQYTNPEKVLHPYSGAYLTLPQADPDGLFKPTSAEGTWLIMLNPDTKQAEPVYVEPRVVTVPFKLPMD